MFSPSPLQTAIFDAIADPQGGNLIVDAKAGSGKTTTILEGMKYIKSSGLLSPAILFLAFNKSIAETLAARCPRHVQCSTFHSLGFRALKASGLVPRSVKVEGRKVSKLVWNALDRDNPDVANVIKLVGLMKSRWPAPQTAVDVQDILLHHEIDLQESQASVAVALRVFEASNRDRDSIDFDDMLFLPVLLNAPFAEQDWIFVDEAQDTNDIQVEILDRLRHPVPPASRLVIVGDPHQAIYGFRGANSDSMDRIAKRFSCRTLPLSVSYRCPKAVIREAQRVLEGII